MVDMKNSEVHLNNESAKIGKEIIPASHSASKEVNGNYHRNRKSVTETVVEENVLKNSSRDTNEANENVENHSGEESEYSKSEIEDKTETVNDDKVNSQTNNNGNEEDHKLLPETDIKAAENEDGKIDDKMNGVPIDRGWAWAVLTGCVLYIIFWGGMVRSYGVFFLEFQERFHAKAAEVAIMNIIQNVTISITSLFTMTVGLKKFNCRTVVAIGGILNALSHIISGITRDIRVFYFSHGLFGGAGIAMVGPPMMSTLGVYFKKHRGLANSIFTASASVGGLILAPVFTTLFEEYGYTGTMLIVAGLLLNSLVSAAFMRPPSWFTTKKNTHRTEKEAVYDKLIQNDAEHVSENQLYEASDYTSAKYNGHGVTSNKDTNDNDRCIANNLQTTKSGHSENSTDTENHTHSFSEKQHSVSRKIKSDGAHESMQKIKCKEKGMYVSGENLHGSLISVNMDIDENETSVTKSTQSFCSSTQAMVADFIKLFDFNLLKDVSVLLYLAMAFVTCSGMVLIPVYLAPFAKDAGLTYDDIAIMLSLAASVDVVSKIVSGIIADRQWIRRSSMLAFAAFATGTVCHIARLCTSKSLILAMAVLAACFYGWYASMYVTILIDTIGLEKFQSSLGFVSVIHGLSVAVFFPISGLLRDITGSYHQTLHLAGGLCYIGTVTLVLLPVVQKRNKRKDAIAKVV